VPAPLILGFVLLMCGAQAQNSGILTPEQLYQVDAISGGPHWQRQCLLSEKECMRDLTDVALQLALDMKTTPGTQTSPARCSTQLQNEIDHMCDRCVSPLCAAGGKNPSMGYEQQQMMRGFYSPEKQASMQIIGPTFDFPTPQPTTRATAQKRGCSFSRCETTFKVSSYHSLAGCSDEAVRVVAVPFHRDWALSEKESSGICVPEPCQVRPNELFRKVECTNILRVPPATYFLERTWDSTTNCTANNALQRRGLQVLDAQLAGVCLPEIDYENGTALAVGNSSVGRYRRYDCSMGTLETQCSGGCNTCKKTRQLSLEVRMGGRTCTQLSHNSSTEESAYEFGKCNWYKVFQISAFDVCSTSPDQEIVADRKISHPQAASAVAISLLGHGSKVCPTSVCARDPVTVEYCSGEKEDLTKCFKTKQECPAGYPGQPGTPSGIPGSFLIMNIWVVQDFSVGANNGTGGDCLPAEFPNLRYSLKDKTCVPMMQPKNNLFWILDISAAILKSNCKDATCSDCSTKLPLKDVPGFTSKRGSTGVCTSSIDVTGATIWRSAYISLNTRRRRTSTPSAPTVERPASTSRSSSGCSVSARIGSRLLVVLLVWGCYVLGERRG